MAKRRSLSDGIKSPQGSISEQERKFVYGPKESSSLPDETPRPEPNADDRPPNAQSTPEAAPELPLNQPQARLPLSTRIRGDIGAALKRASLERQLSGQKPYEIQDILDVALEPWLKKHGYLK